MHIELSDPPLMPENGCFSGTGDFAAEKKGLKALPNDTFSFLQSGWEVIQVTLWTNLLGVSGIFSFWIRFRVEESCYSRVQGIT